jgi:hypothetical protein
MDQLKKDIAESPNAFEFLGPPDKSMIEAVLAVLDHPASDEVRGLWSVVGGGHMFETEDVLGPTPKGLYSLRDHNEELRSAGLDRDLLVFHRGLYLTAVDRGGILWALDPETLEKARGFDTLADWYDDLRREYVSTYGLPTPAT